VLSGLGGAILGAWFVRSRGPHALPPAIRVSPMMLSLALWLVLSLYWEWAARTAAATRSAESGASRGLHLLFVSAAQLLTFWPFAGWPAATAPILEFPRVLPVASFLVPLAIALVAIAYTRKIGLEERNLARAFGSSFYDYRRRSWALIPWVV
jgi:protein-S-isoprenylcysteine O-methyltransferase Ste14